jgi:hypothetical protein
MLGRTYTLYRKSVSTIEAIEGARYSFRRAGLLNIAKIISKFKIVPEMLTIVDKIPKVFDSPSVRKNELGSVKFDVGNKGLQGYQQLSLFSDVLILICTLT